jgi:hypothetical protein
MNYLNPSPAHVEYIEVMRAAKFVHWAQNDAAHRAVQLAFGAEVFKKNMFNPAIHYSLNGKDDITGLLVVDIATSAAPKAWKFSRRSERATNEALLKLGEPEYQTTLVMLRKKVDRLFADGTLGKRK